MVILIKVISILLWVVYSILEGVREAYYYDSVLKSTNRYNNIHLMFLLQRLSVMLLIGFLSCSLFLPIGLLLVFPFIHDGFYYETRNDLNNSVYVNRFRDSSTTSTAIMEFNYSERILLLIFGILIITTSFLSI